LHGYRWQDAGSGPLAAGKTLLIGSRGVVAVLNFQNYAMALNPSTLLVWYQERVAQPTLGPAVSGPTVLLIFEPDQLTPLGPDLDSVFRIMDADKLSILIGGEPSARCELESGNVSDEITVIFPTQLQQIEELLILCHSTGIPSGNGWDRADLALMVVRPRESRYRLYSQDWFNEAGLDYGYQWVTRVVRNATTGHVHGEGIRISSFVLDDSLRKLRYEDRN